ncbi:GNAT family N-acetyltransferase [Bacteroidota bacterium]
MKLPDGFKIRRAGNSDIPKIKELIFSILEEYGLKSDPTGTDRDLSNIEKHYLQRNGIFDILLNNENLIIATTALYKTNSDTCELRKMYLLKQYRGQDLGKYLLEHSLKRAVKLGFKKVILETTSVLKEAIELYKSYGFKPLNSEHLSSRCDKSYFLILNKQE